MISLKAVENYVMNICLSRSNLHIKDGWRLKLNHEQMTEGENKGIED